MAQQVTSGLPSNPTTTTTTVYVGNLEEIATTSGNPSTITTTTYYYAGSLRIAMAVGGPTSGTVSYLCTDALGSTTVALSGSGAGGVTADQLYGPYGAGRYQSGTMPTDYGYTGQHADATTGLDYYNARYYDPLASQFTTADSILPGNGYDPWGLSRYAYVEGNPETRTDATGHCFPLCLPLPVITAVVGAVVGAAVAVQSMVSAAQSGTFGWGTVAQAGADIALGAGAGLAIGVNPVGAGLGAFGSALGVGLGVATGGKFNLQSAFENVAVGAIAGAVGGGVGTNIAKNVATAGARMILQTAVQGVIGGAADLGAQAINQMGAVINGRQSWQFDLAETGMAFGFSALGGAVAQRIIEGAGIGGAKYLAGASKATRAAANWVGGAIQGIGSLAGNGFGGWHQANSELGGFWRW